jgi:LuxR family maltose regulon positive regulatory protein
MQQHRISQHRISTVSSGIVPRQRLLDLIDGPELAPITLITAPAGYGKSTIAHQWVTHHPTRACGWYQIRTEHNSLGTFLHNLWRAIDAATGESEDPPQEVSIGIVLERLRRQPASIVLVLDDYHLIENELIHQVVEVLLRDLPDSKYIVIRPGSAALATRSRLHLRRGQANLRALSRARRSAAAANRAVGRVDRRTAAHADVSQPEQRSRV